MDSNYTNGPPLDHMHNIDSNYANNYSYPLFQASTQPSNQAAFLWDTDNIYTSGNEQWKYRASYGYVRNNENRVNSSSHPPHPLVQTLPTSTLANNSGMVTNATGHGCIIIVIKQILTWKDYCPYVGG